MNCMIIDDEQMSRLALKMLIEQTNFLHLHHEFESPVQAIAHLGEVDLVFLDVEMPQMTGLQFLENVAIAPQIILTTSKPEYAVNAFEYSVTDYLVKPLEYPRFLKAVLKAQQNHKASMANAIPYNTTSDSIFIRTDARIVKISLSHITYIEALADYVTLHVGEERYIIHATMKALEKKLPITEFVRVHRSFIVNINKITAIEDFNIAIGKRVIPIGASYKDSFLKKINFL